MRVYYGKNKENRELIGEGTTVKECRVIMEKYIKDNNLYSTPYRREWIYEGELIVDFGSWSNYFFIPEADNYISSIVKD